MNQTIHYTTDELAKIMHASYINKNAALVPATSISLDSRKIVDAGNTIFFALRSSHHDGNKFVESLYGKGVRNFVVSDAAIPAHQLPLANVLLVNNATRALQQLAVHHRSRYRRLTVIGITGSNGKTIVKEWLNQLLEESFPVVRSPKSYNSQIGVPLSVLNINESHRLGIFEAGISQPGEMKQLEKIIRPSIGLLTNIGRAHDEGFRNGEEKIAEKLCLFRHSKQLVYCSDNKAVQKGVGVFLKTLPASHQDLQLFSWGKSPDSSLRVVTVKKSGIHTHIKAVYQGEKIVIAIPFTDDASIENAIHCWCVLLTLEINDAASRKKFESLYPIAMRLELKTGINNCTIINDSYSNDMHSLEIALNFLAQQKQNKKHTVILSDILQSGMLPDRLYQEIAGMLHHKKISRLIGIGPAIYMQQEKFRFLKEVHFFRDVEGYLSAFKSPDFHDEIILIKGARSFGFEVITHHLEQKAHQTVLSINLTAVVHNLKQYQLLLRPGTKLMAMVKAFSYGSGGAEIASVLEYNKVDYLAVAYADEGVELRKAGITLPIMVMNAEPATFDSILNHNLEPEIFSFDILRDLVSFLKTSGVNEYPVHLKIDTGMHRLGFTPGDIEALCRELRGNSAVKVVTVFTHLVAAENRKEDAFTEEQAQIYARCVEKIEAVIGYPFLKHMSNTAGISRHPSVQLDMVRLGIGLYGIDSNRAIQPRLKNVTTLTTTVSQVKKVKAGDTVGYGRNARLRRDSLIATVRIGYADGYPRNLGNGIGKMSWKGRLVPVVGNICMDMTMLDATGMGNVREGDEITVFGEHLPLPLLAGWAQTIPYEIMTGISQRVKRVYFEE